MDNKNEILIDDSVKNIKENGAFLTAGNMNKVNSMAISWCAIGSLWMKNVAIIAIANMRYTKEFIDKDGTFTISVPFDKSMDKAIQFCGHNSGRNIDKKKELNLQYIKGRKMDTPIVDGCRAYYECRVVFSQPMDVSEMECDFPHDKEEDKQTMYFGEIIDSYYK